MMVPIREAGFPCGTFAYPNDQTILQSAQLLSGELRRLAVQHPICRVALVCHSMGSLVARACVEDPLYDPGNVQRLIMIAPPTNGTLIAHLRWEPIFGNIGLRGARVDLGVGLGIRSSMGWVKRPTTCALIRHSCANSTRDRATQVSAIRFCSGREQRSTMPRWHGFAESVCESLAKVPGAGRRAERLDAILSDIDELVEGKGDGIVAVKRGRLDGVR